jgi:hypothetical protein
MTPAEVGKELVFPVVQPATLMPMLVTTLLLSIVSFFGILFGGMLLLATLFPFAGYLMRLLEARSADRPAPPFDAELLQFFGTPISLVPLVLFSFIYWFGFAAVRYVGPELSWMAVMLLFACLPASLAILAVTRSPLASLNPISVYKFIRATFSDYFVMVIVLEFIGGVLIKTQFLVDPPGFRIISAVYFLFLLYSYTGAVSARNKIAEQVDIALPTPVSAEDIHKTLISDREKVASHAYGFASRGNRKGAFEHVEAHVSGEDDPDDARTWFFNKMMTWDDRDIALFYAQISLHHFLVGSQDALALKLMSQCLHQNPQFRPQRDDREAAMQLAENYGREDLLKQLK